MSVETAVPEQEVNADPTPPAQINNHSVPARILRQKVWDRMNVKDEHFMGAIVGREGHGKSHTALGIGESVDPTFTAERVMFDPGAFLERLKEWKAAGETKGKFIVCDEAGVGVGVRTWYDQDQIKFNQVLQVIRDENMGIMFTLPRLNELDSQTRGRLHAFLEIVDKVEGEFVEIKWKNMLPTRDENNKIIKPYPRLRKNGRTVRVTRVRFGPPSDELVAGYEERKNEFQAELYQDAIDSRKDDDADEMSPGDVSEEIATERGLDDFLTIHGSWNCPIIDADMIRMEYDLSHRDAKAVKKLLNKRDDVEVPDEL